MKKWNKVLLIVIVSVLTLLWYNPAALAQNVLAGVDLWETRPGDATFNFGGGPECPPLPADFFGPGSDPFDGVVAFQGQPLPTTPSGVLGSTDTIVQRWADANLPTCPSSDTVPIEIKALSLVSTAPIEVTYDGGLYSEIWDVQMCLSSETSQPIGSKTINKDCDEGGTFTAVIPLTPKFIFTRVDPPYDQRILDYGLTGDVVEYSVLDGYWLYADPGFNVITSPGGVLVDHDCDGITNAAVGPGSNFYPGLQAVPCDCQSEPADYNMALTSWQSQACGEHGVYPPQAVQPTIEPQIATECPVVETFCPYIPTWCPEDPTYCPKEPFTLCPLGEYTICPEEPTWCATEWTYCPDWGPTWCPEFFTECPMVPTECFPVETECSFLTTQCPIIFTWCPVDPTYCPNDLVPTWCYYEPTICPYEETFCPTEFTLCPDNPTWCPEDITNCPMDWTTCPDVPTECPVNQTTCPATPTSCLTGPTICAGVDTDADGYDDCNDNCIDYPNGPLQGTCTAGDIMALCMNNSDCDLGMIPGVCSKNQEDTLPTPPPNNCGDACECINDINDDGVVNPGDDAALYANFPRNLLKNPCTNLDPCPNDLNCDQVVNPADDAVLYSNFPRNVLKNPCPPCSRDGWPCVYPEP